VKDPDCGLIFLGRLDHQAKIRGHRVDLQEVEAIAREAAGSESVAALPWPPGETELARHVVIFVAGEEGTADTIIAHCQRRLPPVVVPREIHFLPVWPLTGSGKTDYAALKQTLMASHGEHCRP